MKKVKLYLTVIIAAAFLAAVVSYFAAAWQHIPVYQSETTLAIDGPESNGDLHVRLNSAAGRADAFAELLNSPLMHRTILEALELERFDGSILAERIPETNLLDLRVTASDPQMAFQCIRSVLEQHGEITGQVIGDLAVTVLQEPQLPDKPVNPLNLTDRVGSAALYAALLAAVLCIWHIWSRNAVGTARGEENRPELDFPKLLGDMLGHARRIWIAGVGMILACAVGLCAFQYGRYQPVYEMSASFTVRLLHGEDDGFPSKTADQLAKTMPQILTGDILTHQIMENLALEEKPDVQLSVSAGSGIMTLTVRNSDPELAWEVLSAILSCYPEVAEHVVGSTKLILLEESRIPEDPINPFSAWIQIRNGACIGLGLWLLTAMLQALYHATIHSEKELSRLLPCACVEKIGDGVDSLRADVLLENKILLVTSALPGEGKSTAAWNLAQSMSKQGKRVLLAECSPGNPSLTRKFGLRGKAGLSEYLTGQAEIWEIIHKNRIGNLYVVTWGRKTEKHEIQSKSRGAKLRTASGKLFDCVILDGPPVSGMENIADVAELADGAVLVVRKNWTTREQVKESEEQLREWGIPVVGSILSNGK